MLKLFILILSISTRVDIFKNRFTGCDSILFPNPTNFSLIKIDFSTSCKNLEICAEDTSKPLVDGKLDGGLVMIVIRGRVLI